MDLIRLIKLKKINGELDELTTVEKAFVSLLDDFDKKEQRGSQTHYSKNGAIRFSYDVDEKLFYYSYYVYEKMCEVVYIKHGRDFDILVRNFFKNKIGIDLKIK